MASSSTAVPRGPNPLTMTVIGCGTMGIAILGGILSSLAELDNPSSAPAAPAVDNVPDRLPSHFIACVRSPGSAKRVEAELKNNPALEVLRGDNVTATQRAEVVLLGCKPYMAKDILAQQGMRKALAGKVLVSILAGVTVEQMDEYIYGPDSSKYAESERCRIVRAMPNTAALVRQSMTVIATSSPPLAPKVSTLVTWIFERIGAVVYLPPQNMDACTALCGSGPAFCLLALEGLIAGAVAMGLPKAEAQQMAAQTMAGASGLVLNGEHPSVLKDNVTTPGGCTIGGLLVLEEGSVRGTMARAVREATVVASQLGQGAQGVNGTRFVTR